MRGTRTEAAATLKVQYNSLLPFELEGNPIHLGRKNERLTCRGKQRNSSWILSWQISWSFISLSTGFFSSSSWLTKIWIFLHRKGFTQRWSSWKYWESCSLPWISQKTSLWLQRTVKESVVWGFFAPSWPMRAFCHRFGHQEWATAGLLVQSIPIHHITLKYNQRQTTFAFFRPSIYTSKPQIYQCIKDKLLEINIQNKVNLSKIGKTSMKHIKLQNTDCPSFL